MRNWIDVTVFGEAWQVEMTEDQSEWQHRARDNAGAEQWQHGRPPTGFHSQAAADKRAA